MNQNKDTKSLLTPAAYETLSEIISDFEDKVILSAYQIAQKYSENVEEISVHDVIEAIREIDYKFHEKSEERDSFKSKFYVVSNLMFLTIITVLIIYFVITNIYDVPSSISEDYLFMFSLFLISVFFSWSLIPIIKTITQNLRKKNNISNKIDSDIHKSNYQLLFINSWNDFELRMRELIAEYFGESKTRGSLNYLLLNMLIEYNVISNEDYKNFQIYYKLRNSVAHEESKITSEEYQDFLKFYNRIVFSIKKELKSRTNKL